MINPNELRTLVESRPDLVRAKRSERYPELRVLKYTNKVHYDNLWDLNPLLVECRGLAVDDDYNVVVKPFTKIFNYGENGTKIDRDEMCTVVRKVNGFFSAATAWKGQVIVSTTGTLDSDYAKLAEKHIEPFKKEILSYWDGISFAFEIVDKTDPHIIDEEVGAHLIGSYFLRHDRAASESELDLAFKPRNGSIGSKLGNFRPEWFVMRFSDAVKLSKTVKHEGFVVYGHTSGTVLKLKSPFYLVTKLFARMKPEKLERILKGVEKVRGVDEDYLPVVEYLKENGEAFLAMTEQEKVAFVRNYIENEVLV